MSTALSLAPTAAGDALTALRSAARERVGALTVPNTHDEAWRFTSIAALNRTPLHELGAPTALTRDDIARGSVPEAAQRLVFINGVHAPHLDLNASPTAVAVSTLAQALTTHPEAVLVHLGQLAQDPQHRFTAQNTAHLVDAAVVIAPRNAVASAPVHLLFVATQPHVLRLRCTTRMRKWMRWWRAFAACSRSLPERPAIPSTTRPP